ncbi:hypothetical protein M3Y94_00768400 [Aphelenchoides besseyi]|nr:hypothetical protein M3Y94_00768400 [Aphelenchoides besseyi]KAI6232241.1 Piwi domain-containing protein [Aphelenchoides besseyi]
MVENVTNGLAMMSTGKLNYVSSQNGRTTIYKMKVAPNMIVYRYDVDIVKPAAGRRPEKIYTKQNDAGMRTAQRKACNELVETLYTLTQQFGAGTDCKYVYDGKRTLYTTKEIKLQRQMITIQPTQMPEQTAKFVKNDSVNVTITANESLPKLDYSDLRSALVSDVAVQADRSVRTFLELLTSQFFINSGEYQNVSVGTLFENRTKALVPGMEMRVGFKKGVRVTEDDNGKPNALLVVDMKRTAFFASKKASDIYAEFLKDARNTVDANNKFERHMKDVRVVVSYDTSRTFVFQRLTQGPLDSPKFSVNRKSLPQFMKDQHNLIIANPKWPGVHPAGPNGKNVVYPLEAIQVLHGQLVPIEKLHAQASRQLLMENSVVAKERYTYVQQQVRKLATGDSAAFLKHFGVTLDVESNKIKINQRKTPKIQYKDCVIQPDPKGAWMNEAVKQKFLNGSVRLKHWIVVYDKRLSEQKVKSFIKNLITKARNLGMVLADPTHYIQSELINLQEIFSTYKPNMQFIFYLDEHFAQSHGKLKLYEAYYKILTQHVVAKNLDAQPQTLTNIAMKWNAKCFGLNYVPELSAELASYELKEKGDLLVIGMDVSHPNKMTGAEKFKFSKEHHITENPPENRHPSVVGISANKGPDPRSFAGDFFYQETRKECINQESLTNAVANIVALAVKNNRRPKRIIVVRDGLSEGQMSMAASTELPAIRAGWRQGVPANSATANLNCKITFVVCTKQHNKRFYRDNGKDITNTCPGDVIDSSVTRSDQPEFYLQAHYPLKGVPKMSQYGVVCNELGMTMEELQQFMVYLSNMHQICASPTSLPAPVYVAHETAKRGQNIYNELYELRNPNRRGVPNEPNFAPELVIENGTFDFAKLTEALSYSSSRLAGTRFNA